MKPFEKLLSPKKIGSMEVPNRMVVTAAVTLTCDKHGYATENFIGYYEAKAKGGWGLIVVEDCAVAPSGKSFKLVPGLWEDGQICGHAELTRRVHRYGAKVMAQIYHCGRQTTPANIHGESPLAPTRIIDPRTGAMPREMSTDEVIAMVGKFGDAAYRAKLAGYDGVEIHGGHGYLVNEFFSHYSNKRVDQYGGNILNRCRFAQEIIRDIKGKCGEEFVVGIRISADEFVPGGLTIEDSKVIARLLEENRLDVINVSVAVNGSVQNVAAPAAVRHGVYTSLAADIKMAVNIPVIGLGRINDPFLADSVLSTGKCDFVGMLRASMADPEMPNKVKEGRIEDIITCIGCLIGCSGQLAKGQPAACIFNPAMGRETKMAIKEAKVKKSVIVVGGGVGGMAAAITAARCGHTVTLIEKGNRLGGQFYYAAIPPEKGEISAYIVQQHTQLKKLGIQILMDTEATSDLLDAMSPDIVIVATGGKPVIPPIPGSDKKHVFTALQVLEGVNLLGKRCVVIGGGLVGSETTHHLMYHGYQVNGIVEMLPVIMSDMPNNPKHFLLQDFKAASLNIYTSTLAKEIQDDALVVVKDGIELRIEADFIVAATGSKPDDKLASELESKPYKVITIGDAVQVRRAYEAIREGYEVALAL